MKSSARYTLSNQQAQLKEAETVNLIENAQRHFQGLLFGCFEYVPYTALTIVCTINVSIDCKKNKVSNLIENQSNEMLGLCFVLK